MRLEGLRRSNNSDVDNWVNPSYVNGDTAVDVFFICPSVFGGKEGSYLTDLANCNEGGPLILAGFSQEADMVIRQMKDCFANETLQNQLIVCCAIGWAVTREDVDTRPRLKPVQGKDDTGVIAATSTEAEDVTESLLNGRITQEFAAERAGTHWDVHGELTFTTWVLANAGCKGCAIW